MLAQSEFKIIIFSSGSNIDLKFEETLTKIRSSLDTTTDCGYVEI